MDSVNQTLYIPLYGKSYVSRKGLFLEDPRAEQIWAEEGFPLRGKSRSKWLAYYMGIRAVVFDRWLLQKLEEDPEAVVLHVGCGMDSRVLRVNATARKWYDIDLPAVITERKRYYSETDNYRMLAGDLREQSWLERIPETGSAIVVMEGVSMYLSPEELRAVTNSLSCRFERVLCLMDCYTTIAARLSKYRNPINDVGVTAVYGMDDPVSLQDGRFLFVKEHPMIPERYLNELHGVEKDIFKKLYAGSLSKKLYRLYEYGKG